MNIPSTTEELLLQYRKGRRYFTEVYLEEGNLEGADLRDAVFEHCLFYISFRGADLRNARFINGGIKCCDFREADLTGTHFESLAIESAQFARAKVQGVFFDNNSAYGHPVTGADFDDWIKDHEE